MDGKIISQVLGNETIIQPGETLTAQVSEKVENLHFWSCGGMVIFIMSIPHFM